MFGFRSKEFAIDLGSSHIRIGNAEQGLLVSEASRVIAYQQNKGERVVLAFGNSAKDMHGKIPMPLEEIMIIRDGAVWDKDGLREIIRNLMVLVNERLLWVNQEICICLPAQANLVEKKTLQKIMKEAGGGKVRFVNRAKAVAEAIQIPYHEPYGHLVIDIGAHTTEMTVLSCSDVVQSKLLRLGGEMLGKGIVRYLRKEFNIEISLQQAESLKEKYGKAMWFEEETNEVISLKGKSAIDGFPILTSIDAREITIGLGHGLQMILEAIQDFLDEIPLELATDIAQTGIVLVGGGALLEEIDEAIRIHTNMPVIIPENPDALCVIGALEL